MYVSIFLPDIIPQYSTIYCRNLSRGCTHYIITQLLKIISKIGIDTAIITYYRVRTNELLL